MKPKPLAWTPEHVAAFWDYWAQRRDSHAHYFTHQVGKGVCKFLAHVSPIANLKVLDYGAGPGYLVEQLMQRGAFVSAAEFSKASVDELNQRFKRDRFWSGAKKFNGHRLPWDDNQFDIVVCCETIEHLVPEHLGPVLSELHRVLKPGAPVLFTTPNSENLRASTVFCPECCHEFHRWQHVRRWTPTSLSTHLTKAGYEVRFCEPLSFHDFQPPRPTVRELMRFGFWRRTLLDVLAAVRDRFEPREFPNGWVLGRRLSKTSGQHLAAVACKPVAAAKTMNEAA